MNRLCRTKHGSGAWWNSILRCILIYHHIFCWFFEEILILCLLISILQRIQLTIRSICAECVSLLTTTNIDAVFVCVCRNTLYFKVKITNIELALLVYCVPRDTICHHRRHHRLYRRCFVVVDGYRQCWLLNKYVSIHSRPSFHQRRVYWLLLAVVSTDLVCHGVMFTFVAVRSVCCCFASCVRFPNI